jgi:hypothetical protein
MPMTPGQGQPQQQDPNENAFGQNAGYSVPQHVVNAFFPQSPKGG